MATLKLNRLPDRTPVKLGVTISPELHQSLQAYAIVYEQSYGVAEPLTELISAMLASFLESDRAFLRARTSPGPDGP